MKRILAFMLLCMTMTATASAQKLSVHTHMGARAYNSNVEMVKAAKDMNMGWIRDECTWAHVETAKGQRRIPDKVWDYLERTEEAGINQLMIIGYSNGLYYKEGQKGPLFPTKDNEEYFTAFLEYVRFTVSNVKDYVDAYEIWNEPNIQGFNYEMADGTEYAKLYLEASAIIKELDPTAKVLCGCITGTSKDAENYGRDIFKYVQSQGDVNQLIDAFSIHIYTHDIDGTYSNGLELWEKVFDDYGFLGDVWMTENGTSSADGNATEALQAYHATMRGMRWENYLKQSGRKGENFWYELTNTGRDKSEYEDNFGLIDLNYEPKPVYYAMKHYNNLVGDKEFSEMTRVLTHDFIFFDDYYGYIGKYENEYETAYILYDTHNQKKSVNVALSGDIAYVYDYLGNVTETIKNPGGNKAITMTDSPKSVRCVTYMCDLDEVSFDKDENILKLSGKTNVGDFVTVQLIKNGKVVKAEKMTVRDKQFDKWISVSEGGDYTIRVGQPEYANVGKTSGWAEKNLRIDTYTDKTKVSSGTNVTYDETTRNVSISGRIENFPEEAYVTAFVVPESMELSKIDKYGIGYAGEVEVINGNFSIEFTLPDYFNTKASVYLGGTNITNKDTENLDIPESKYVYAASFETQKGKTISATAGFKNFAEAEKKATIILAQYDESGRLLKVVCKEQTIPSRTYATVYGELNGVEILDDTKKAEAFLWSDMTGIVSLTQNRELIIK